MKRLFYAVLFFLMIAPIQTVNAAPDFTSPYLPEIKSISWSGLNFRYGDGSLDASSKTQFDVSARIHRNSLTYFSASFANSVNYKPTALEPNCVNTIRLRAGDPFGSLNAPSLNLSSRVVDGDRYTERYVIEAEGAANGPLCPGEYSLSFIEIYDTAGRNLNIRLGSWYNSGRLDQSSLFWGKMGETNSLLPCKVIGKGLNPLNPELWLELCNQSLSSKTIQFTVKATERKSLALPETVDYISKLAQSQNQISILSTDKTSLQSQVTSLTADKTSLQSQVTSLTLDRTSLQSRVTSLTSDKSTLQTQVAAVTNDKVNLQSQINTLTTDKSALQSQLNNFATENSALQNQVSQLNSKLVAALAGQNAANAKFKKVCLAKPKPKGC
jgi:regulator of replication initiation timing